MRSRDRDRGLDAAYARLVEQTDRAVETPDVTTIHRRVDLRAVRGIGLTFAGTATAGLLIGAVVLGVGGIGMAPDAGRAGGHRAATPTARTAGPVTTTPMPLTGPRGTARAPRRPSPAPTAPPVPTAAAAPRTASGPPSRGHSSATGPTPSGSVPRSVSATPVTPSRVPPPSPSSAMNATTVPRPPLRLRVAYKSGQLDEVGCRRTRRVERSVAAPGPEAVVRAVLAGPSAAERDDGVHTLYGRSGTPTPARVGADWSRQVVTVDLTAPGAVSYFPAACRGPEIRGPVVDAVRQSHPGWTVRFTLQGSAERFTDYVHGG